MCRISRLREGIAGGHGKTMSKTSDERDWYLAEGYGQGGWHRRFMDSFKKWRAHHAKLLKDGYLEKDEKYDMFRITEKGILRVRASRYKNFLSRMELSVNDKPQNTDREERQ
jgi:hypothetical protein